MRAVCACRPILVFLSSPFFIASVLFTYLHLAKGQQRGPAASSLSVFVLGPVPSQVTDSLIT